MANIWNKKGDIHKDSAGIKKKTKIKYYDKSYTKKRNISKLTSRYTKI